MSTEKAYKRLMIEFNSILTEGIPYILIIPDEENILLWDFVITGPPDCPYTGGEYHGRLKFKNTYPFTPPDVEMFTPSGRFETGRDICTSFTSFHKEDWSPSWNIATLMTGFLSFMLQESDGLGSISRSKNERKRMAEDSRRWNRNDNQNGFLQKFPHLVNN